jgi:acetyl-CoA carboxylase carboxyltransferase component
VRLAAVYAREHATVEVAARGGYVDEIVQPGETRDRLAWALDTLGGKL